MLLVAWNLPAGKDLLVGREYQLADGASYAGWLVEWQLHLAWQVAYLHIG